VKFIEKNRKGPFLAYLSFYDFHTPLMPRDDLRKKCEKKAKGLKSVAERWGKERANKVRLVQDHAVYAGMVEAMDQAVGKVLRALEHLKLDGRTIVVFTSDNGGLSTSEGHPTSNLPSRAGKGWLYDGGVRVPWIMRAPGVTKAESACAEPVVSTDFFPTLLALTGRRPPAKVTIDGRPLVPLLKGRS